MLHMAQAGLHAPHVHSTRIVWWDTFFGQLSRQAGSQPGSAQKTSMQEAGSALPRCCNMQLHSFRASAGRQPTGWADHL